MKLQFTITLLFLIFYPRSQGVPVNEESSSGGILNGLKDTIKNWVYHQDSPKEGEDDPKHSSVDRQGEDSVKVKTVLDRLVKMAKTGTDTAKEMAAIAYERLNYVLQNSADKIVEIQVGSQSIMTDIGILGSTERTKNQRDTNVLVRFFRGMIEWVKSVWGWVFSPRVSVSKPSGTVNEPSHPGGKLLEQKPHTAGKKHSKSESKNSEESTLEWVETGKPKNKREHEVGTDVSDDEKKEHTNGKAAGHREGKKDRGSSEDESSDSEEESGSKTSGETESADKEDKRKKKTTREDISRSLARNAHASDASKSQN